jgi:hypothetical protein
MTNLSHANNAKRLVSAGGIVSGLGEAVTHLDYGNSLVITASASRYGRDLDPTPAHRTAPPSGKPCAKGRRYPVGGTGRPGPYSESSNFSSGVQRSSGSTLGAAS